MYVIMISREQTYLVEINQNRTRTLTSPIPAAGDTSPYQRRRTQYSTPGQVDSRTAS
jgi:hypothetical protein